MCRDLTRVLIMENHGVLKESSGPASIGILTAPYTYAKPCQLQLHECDSPAMCLWSQGAYKQRIIDMSGWKGL